MTDKYAVIGNPIAHSKSPQIHKMFAEQTGQDISYEAILAPLDGFAAKIDELRKAGYKGCNVTVPFKFEAYQLANIYHKRVLAAQAVNTLKFEGDLVVGENTDGIGLVRDITDNFNITLRYKRVLLVGAGGAARGVALTLLQAGANLDLVNRTDDKARELTNKLEDSFGLWILFKRRLYAMFGLKYGIPTFVPGFMLLAGKQFDIVINTTSTGLTNEMPPLPPGIFAPGALAYDMMYGRETPFMKFAREQGAAIVSDGLGMLVEQAAESFRIWRGRDVKLDTASVIAALRAQQ